MSSDAGGQARTAVVTATVARRASSGRGQALVAAAGFAAARIRRRPTRGLVTGFGIAVAIAALFVTTAAPVIAGDATLRRALENVPAGARSITVARSVNASTVDELHALDTTIRGSLTAPGLAVPRSELVFRALATPDGTLFRLAGVERLAQVVRVLDGRLPQTCTTAECEVVIVGQADLPLDPTLGLRVVGHVQLTDSSVLAGQFAPEAEETAVLGDGVDPVGAIGSLSLIGRSIAWVAAIDPASVRVGDIDDILGAAAHATAVFTEDSAYIDLPRSALVSARSRAATASSRVTLAATQGVVLVAAFALLAAAGARHRHRAARQLLRQRGATRGALGVFTACEAAWPVAVGFVVGVPGGLAVTAAVAERWDVDAGDVIGDVAGRAIVRALLGAIVLLAATAAVMAAAPSSTRRLPRRWWQPTGLDALGAGALATGALAIDRGSATPSSLVSGGDPLVAALPIIAAIVVAWVAIRFVPPIVGLCARLIPRRTRAPLTRTALGEVRRRPALPLVTAGFLAAATMLAVFSLGYRSTLAAGAHDQAAFSVPFDFRLTSGSALVRPPSVEPDQGWSFLARSARATDVLRRGATVRASDVSTDTLDLVALDPSTLSLLRGWRSDFGPATAVMARSIAATEPIGPFGSAIAAGSTQLVISGGGDFGRLEIAAVIARVDGTWHEVMSTFDEDTPDRVVVTLTDGDAGGRLVGFRLAQPGRQSQLTEHHIGEGDTTTAFFTANLHVDDVAAVDASDAGNGTSIDVRWGELSAAGATITAGTSGTDISLRLQGAAAVLLPPVPTEASPLAAIVDPRTAASAENGLLTVELPGLYKLTLRVAGVADRFPGAAGRFAITDIALTQPRLDLLDPGLGTANETWIAVDRSDVDTMAAALRSGPRADVVVANRASVESRLRSDPLSRFTLALFGVAAIVAALLAVAAVYLATASDAAEQAPLHRALAAEGVAPGALSRMVRTTAIAIVAAAMMIGIGGSLALLRLVTRVIAVTANSTVPNPPLLADIATADLVVAVVALLAASIVASALAARAARRAAQGDLLREFG